VLPCLNSACIISVKEARVAVPRDLSKFDALVKIIARLRAPEGCPWDRQQTHASLRGNLLSECYEALEALDEGDAERLYEELGDLLLQIVVSIPKLSAATPTFSAPVRPIVPRR
jgi:tetrapyrrole methylase family protein/MazG family protein